MKQEALMPFYIVTDFQKSLDVKSGDWIIEGIASTPHIDRENDIVMASAVKNALKSYKEMPVLRYQHKDPIGKVLEMKYTPDGLYIKAKISNIQETKGIWQLIKDGVIRGLSIAGKILKASKKKNDDGKEVRTIEKMELHEISIVDIPANSNSKLNVVKAYNAYMKKEEKNMNEEQPEWVQPLEDTMKKLTEAVTNLSKSLTQPYEETELEKKFYDDLIKSLEKQEDEPDEEEEEDEDEEKAKKKKKAMTENDIKKMVEDKMKEDTYRKAITSETPLGQVQDPVKKGSVVRQALAKRYNVDDGEEEW